MVSIAPSWFLLVSSCWLMVASLLSVLDDHISSMDRLLFTSCLYHGNKLDFIHLDHLLLYAIGSKWILMPLARQESVEWTNNKEKKQFVLFLVALRALWLLFQLAWIPSLSLSFPHFSYFLFSRFFPSCSLLSHLFFLLLSPPLVSVFPSSLRACWSGKLNAGPKPSMRNRAFRVFLFDFLLNSWSV